MPEPLPHRADLARGDIGWTWDDQIWCDVSCGEHRHLLDKHGVRYDKLDRAGKVLPTGFQPDCTACHVTADATYIHMIAVHANQATAEAIGDSVLRQVALETDRQSFKEGETKFEPGTRPDGSEGLMPGEEVEVQE